LEPVLHAARKGIDALNAYLNYFYSFRQASILF